MTKRMKRFVIPEGPMGDVVKRRFFKDLGEKWRNHKCALKERHFDEARTPQEVKSQAPSNVNLDQFYNLVDFWFSATGRDRSQRGKQSRSLQTSLHTGGSQSFARHAYEMVNRDAQNVAHPKQVPSIPRSAHASTNDLGATLDANVGAGAGADANDDSVDSASAAKDKSIPSSVSTKEVNICHIISIWDRNVRIKCYH
ncbi:hypothetical protein CJ030_MR0G015480 [Morella rubra]|uniref:Uncharacterized protein n=1 Tax=Morella rubra TaxID=262757 RepID=A0A6A1UKP9_9ROSI|nr:hypothetical protein CJ030_MR0G015480 [Morella rubra]